LRETLLFACFGAVSFDDCLIGERFLRRVSQAFVALEGFVREIAQCCAEARSARR
jgi:hypothetical protein